MIKKLFIITRDILIEGPVITKFQKNITIEEGVKVIDGSNLVALPGFVNTHHQSISNHV